MSDTGLQETYETKRLPLYEEEDFYQNNLGSTGSGVAAQQHVMNLIPRKFTNFATGDGKISFEKREGFQRNMDVLAKSALAGNMAGRDFISISQLDDVFVGAFYRDNGGTDTIEIFQIRPVANTVTLIGTISTVAGPPAVNVSEFTDVYLYEIKNGNVPGVSVVITNKSGAAGTSAAYYALSSAGVFGAATLTKIADADFPTNQATYIHIVGPMVQLNQIQYVMAADGRIFNSNDDAIGTWSALGFLEAESYPDRGVGLIRWKHHLIAFGEASIEFFNDVGNDPTLGSPLERTDQAFIKFGAIYAKSLINVDDVVYWVSGNNNGTIGIWKLDGYTPVKISTPRIDLDFTYSGDNKNSLNLTSGFINSEKHIIFTGATSFSTLLNAYADDITFETNEPEVLAPEDTTISFHCYSLSTGLWWHMGSEEMRNCGNLYGATSPQLGSSATVRDFNKTYFMCGPPNTIASLGYQTYIMNTTGTALAVYRDFDSNAGTQTLYYTWIWQSNKKWFATEKRKFLHKLKIINNNPVLTDDTNPNHIKCMFVRDGEYSGQPTPQIRTKAIGLSSAKPTRFYWNNFGAFRKCQFVLFGKHKNQFSFDEIEMDLSQGGA